MIIHLEVDPETGKKNVWIKYRSDSDALPMEHEEEHRRLVDQLLESGALNKAEIGEIIIERETGQVIQESSDEDEANDEKQSVDQGN
jgi:hypothetical protein